jgi:hypothetical protein
VIAGADGLDTLDGGAASDAVAADDVDAVIDDIADTVNDDPSSRDLVAPTITIASPADGTVAAFGVEMPFRYSCAGEDLASCDGPDQIDTTVAGVQTVTVRAVDHSGNEATASIAVTVLEPLYRTRAGNPSAGEQPTDIVIERNIAAARLQLDVLDADTDGDGWAVVARSTSTATRDNLATTWVSGGSPHVAARHITRGCVIYRPRSLAPVVDGRTRRLDIVAENSDRCRTADPVADVDGDGVPDNIQTVYRARHGDPARGELATRIYVERNVTAAEAQLGISDYDHDGDGWAAVGRFTTRGALQGWTVGADGRPVVTVRLTATRALPERCQTATVNSVDVVRGTRHRFMTVAPPSTCPA